MSETNPDDPPYIVGTIAGLGAWVVGYLVTYLLHASEVRESVLNRTIDLLGGEPATHELVGWVFYNAHFVDVIYTGLPVVGSQTATFLGGENGLTVMLYLLPVGVLLATGIALARVTGATTPRSGAIVGVTATSGYLLASILGVFLFEVTVSGVSASPELVPGILFAGLAYPVVVATCGGLVAGYISSRQ